jgi:hypothetical protein
MGIRLLCSGSLERSIKLPQKMAVQPTKKWVNSSTMAWHWWIAGAFQVIGAEFADRRTAFMPSLRAAFVGTPFMASA